MNCSNVVESCIGYLGIWYLLSFLDAFLLPPINATLNPTSLTARIDSLDDE